MKFLLLLIFLYGVTFMNIDAKGLIEHPTEGKQYKTLVFRFEKNLEFDNPFDLETNKVEIKIEQPDKSLLNLSFFYNGLNEKNIEKWEARFSPNHIGRYHFQINVKDLIDERFEIPIEDNKEINQGNLILSDNLGLFKYNSGESFRGIEINICWAGDYEYYFKKMKSAGMNITRIWICPWHLSMEWANTGSGKYDLRSAEKLDEILNIAAKYEIYIILCLDYHGIGQNRAGFFNENKWLDNPYNKINGGPCNDASELFTNEEAKSFFKKKYKYIISRFGYSSNIASWEFYNEVDLMAGKSIPVNQWHIELAEYLHSIDIHHHLVSTSATRNYPEKVVDAFKSNAMDFVMYHHYNTLDMAPFVLDFHKATTEYYLKPVVLGEFGVEYRGSDRTYDIDPQHIGLHNGIWAGFFSQTPVIPLSWWWDNYIDKYDFWSEYKILSDFSKNINWNSNRIRFKELQSSHLISDNKQQAPSLVTRIYFGQNAALWFKNDKYQWSLFYEGKYPEEIEKFNQTINDLDEGKYSVSWFNPQTGKFFDKQVYVKVGKDGLLNLEVPAFTKDLACFVKLIK